MKLKSQVARLIALALVALLVGCATSPPVIDVSASTYKPRAPGQASLASVVVVNKADDGRMVNTTLGSDSVFPIKPATTTKDTVEADLRTFFGQATKLDSGARRKLKVTIAKADSYWVWSSAAKIPFVGIALSAADTEVGMNLRVLFEVEEGEKVVSSYLFDDKITIQSGTATQEAIAASYQKLIAAYRQKFFGELEQDFLRRYL